MAGWLLNTSIREGELTFLQEHIQSTTYIWEATLLTKWWLTKVWGVVSQNYCDHYGLVIFILSQSARGRGGGGEGGLLHHNTWQYLYRCGIPDLRRGIHFHFLERGIIFQTYKSSSTYQQRICTQKNTLTNQSNRCRSPDRCCLCCEVRYRKVAIVELSCDITRSITLNLQNGVSFWMQILS